MTSIAYKQYCNIFYNGELCLHTDKRSMSTSQTPSTVENKNRGVTKSKNGQPEKFGSSDDGNTFSLGRLYHKVLDGNYKRPDLQMEKILSMSLHLNLHLEPPF